MTFSISFKKAYGFNAMIAETKKLIRIDLNQFKLHIFLKSGVELTLHFNSPSRRFYLAVIGLVVYEMKKQGKIISIPLEKHLDVVALLNETVGKSAGSSKKEQLLPRIYKKWKAALPDLENAPLFKVVGRKKRYDDLTNKVYAFSEEEKDKWANLFDYKGSNEHVRLRFSTDRLGASLDDVMIVFGESPGLINGDAWEEFIARLKEKRKDSSKSKRTDHELKSPDLPQPQPEKWPRSTPGRWRWLAIGALILLVVGVSALAVWKINSSAPQDEIASVEKMVLPLPDKPSIAVLPFSNMSDDPKQDHFCDGLAEDIITALSKTPKLFVIARNSTFTYKGKAVKVNQVAEELGVQYVLEGSVRKEGDRVRITAQLNDALSGYHLWAERYDRELKDLFALQDEITIKILTALRVNLTRGESARIYTKGTENLEAYLKAVKAQEHILRFTKDDNRIAQQLAGEIVTIDPKWPNGYILLGWTHFVDARSGFGNSPKESLSRAEVSARKALELDDTLSIPHLILGKIHYLRKNWEKAIAEIELAVSIDPTNIDVIYHYARLLVYAGRPEESIPLYKQAMRMDPLFSSLINWGLGTAYFDSGRYTDARLEFERYLERRRKDGHNLKSPHIMMAATCAALHRMGDAQGHAQEVFKIDPEFSLKQFIKRYPYKDQADKDRWMDALQKAGLE